MKPISPLLLGICTPCGQPIYRHRLPSGRQITCEQLRQIDEAFQASGRDPEAIRRDFHIVTRDGDLGRKDGGQ